jgi:hypothetical protein
MTKQSLKKQYEAATKALHVASDAIYATQQRQDVPFYTCLRQAPEHLRYDYEAAYNWRNTVRVNAIETRKAYRDSLGMLVWYR